MKTICFTLHIRFPYPSFDITFMTKCLWLLAPKIFQLLKSEYIFSPTIYSWCLKKGKNSLKSTTLYLFTKLTQNTLHLVLMNYVYELPCQFLASCYLLEFHGFWRRQPKAVEKHTRTQQPILCFTGKNFPLLYLFWCASSAIETADSSAEFIYTLAKAYHFVTFAQAK